METNIRMTTENMQNLLPSHSRDNVSEEWIKANIGREEKQGLAPIGIDSRHPFNSSTTQLIDSRFEVCIYVHQRRTSIIKYFSSSSTITSSSSSSGLYVHQGKYSLPLQGALLQVFVLSHTKHDIIIP